MRNGFGYLWWISCKEAAATGAAEGSPLAAAGVFTSAKAAAWAPPLGLPGAPPLPQAFPSLPAWPGPAEVPGGLRQRPKGRREGGSSTSS